jgi:hypothetical protein
MNWIRATGHGDSARLALLPWPNQFKRYFLPFSGVAICPLLFRYWALPPFTDKMPVIVPRLSRIVTFPGVIVEDWLIRPAESLITIFCCVLTGSLANVTLEMHSNVRSVMVAVFMLLGIFFLFEDFFTFVGYHI